MEQLDVQQTCKSKLQISLQVQRGNFANPEYICTAVCINTETSKMIDTDIANSYSDIISYHHPLDTNYTHGYRPVQQRTRVTLRGTTLAAPLPTAAPEMEIFNTFKKIIEIHH